MTPQEEPRRPRLFRKGTAYLAAAAVLALMAGTVLTAKIPRGKVGPEYAPSGQLPAASSPAHRDSSIAVLPFTVEAARRDGVRMLAAGIHEDLIDRLSRIDGLKVTARTSSLALRNSTLEPAEISKLLGVSTLLQGDVQLAAGRFKLALRMVDAASGKPLWSQRYERKTSARELFDVQAEAVRSVASAIGVNPDSDRENSRSRQITDSFDAYLALARSKNHARSGLVTGTKWAIDRAREAVTLDPSCADAHVALARALTLSLQTDPAGADESGEEIMAAVDRALALEPKLAGAWSARGDYESVIGSPAQHEYYETAMNLAPGSAEIMRNYGESLYQSGKPDQALVVLLVAAERDPLSHATLMAVGRTRLTLEQFEEARDTFSHVLDFYPQSAAAFAATGDSFLLQGQLDLALHWLQRAQAADPVNIELAASILTIHDSLEDFGAAAEWAEWLELRVTRQVQALAALARHSYLQGDFQSAVQYSNLALRLLPPGSRDSDALFMRIKRDEALAAGDPSAGIEFFRGRHPELFHAVPALGRENLAQSLLLAQLMQFAGDDDAAAQLLQAAIEFYDQPWSVSGQEGAWLVSAKAQALSLLGDSEAALAELDRIVKNGWRLDSRLETVLNANFNTIRKTPGFRRIVDEIGEDLEQQRARAQAMARGTDSSPPADTKRASDPDGLDNLRFGEPVEAFSN
jgi:TolB-like protein/Flp pilus assembly protein TadD